MSEGIIDVLMNKPSDSASFVCDKNADYVELSVPVGGSVGYLESIAGNQGFIYGDNFIVLSIGCVLPLSFQFWNDDKYTRQGCSLYVNNAGGGITHPFEKLPHVWFPFGNYEMSFGIFNPGFGWIDPTIAVNFALRAKFFDDASGNFARISMLNLPESLHEKEFYVPIFIKVLHTLNMFAIPS